MISLTLHDFHQGLGGSFREVNGLEVAADYGDLASEYAALRQTAGVLDLSFRSRLCLVGSARQGFLNGQVTNNIKDLRPWAGCYAALVNSKGRLESDLNIYCLEQELLLDFEPALSGAVQERLNKYIVAEDVQVVDVAPHYGLLSIQGPKSAPLLAALGLPAPVSPYGVNRFENAAFGEIYVANKPAVGGSGFDLFIPSSALAMAAGELLAAARSIGGRFCGWNALEVARIEAGIPRFGVDMDQSLLPAEAGIDSRAVSYSKGCYIGQEVIARLRTYGQPSKRLVGLRLPSELAELPAKGAKLFMDGKEIGAVTSAANSPTLSAPIALAIVRREGAAPGAQLTLAAGAKNIPARVVPLPFISPPSPDK